MPNPTIDLQTCTMEEVSRYYHTTPVAWSLNSANLSEVIINMANRINALETQLATSKRYRVMKAKKKT